MTIHRRFIPLAFLALTFLMAAGAGWIAPYHPRAENRSLSYHPPSRIHLERTSASFLPRLYFFKTRTCIDENLKRTYEEIPGEKFFICPGEGRLFNIPDDARFYLLGADSRGRDVFSRILYGTRISLAIALLGATVACSIGVLIGILAGYFGGRIDQLLMRFSEFFIMIPGFYLLLALRSALPPNLGSKETFTLIVLILSVIGWGSMARVVRGMTLSLRERDFITAARALGRSSPEILFRHILPHLVPYLGVVLSLAIPGYILGESALSLLGLGIQEPDVSLGNLLKDALAIPHIEFHPWVLIPGFWIASISFNFYILGDLESSREDF